MLKFKKNIEALIEIQSKGVEIAKNTDLVLFEYATGVGKSKQALDSIKAIGGNWILVYWETAHLGNWLAEIAEWKYEFSEEELKMTTYMSLPKLMSKLPQNQKYNFIFDEAHHSASPTILPIIEQFVDRGLFLTATMSGERRLLINNALRRELTRVVVKFDKAIDLGILPPPAVYMIPVRLSNVRNQEIIIQKGGKAKWSKLEQTVLEYGKHWAFMKGKTVLNLKVLCSEAEKLEYLNDQVKYLQDIYFSNREPWAKNRWVSSGGERKKYIGSVKTESCRLLLKKLEGKRGIIFGSSIEQIDELGGNLAVHSKLSKKEQNLRINNFQKKETNWLFANQKLVEGMNLVDIEFAVIVQLDKKSLQFVQKTGRAMRSHAPEIYIMVVPNSQDEKYWQECSNEMPEEYVKNILEKDWL